MWVDRIEVWIYSQSQKSMIHSLNLRYNKNVRPNILVSNFVLILLYSLNHFQLNRIFPKKLLKGFLSSQIKCKNSY